MARINNAITFGAGFNISAESPIDSRMRVQYESDLTNPATWPDSTAPLYNGLTTTVMETGDIWVLMDKTKYTDKTTGEGWVNKSKRSEIDDSITTTGTTWSSSKITAELAGIGFDVQIVQSLPVSGDTHTVYFVSSTTADINNVYDEYMYINSDWEQIGSTAIDLSDYYNKTEVDTLLSGKQGTLTAGSNITISNNVISATDTTYSAGSNVSISNGAISADGYRYNTTNGAFAEGDRDINDSGTNRVTSTATGLMSHAEGTNCTASGRASHVEGSSNTASGIQAHAEGSGTSAIGTNAHSEGRSTIANGYGSHAEGDGTETGGNYSSNTSNPKTPDSRTASAGDYAHAEGLATIAYGVNSHSEGKLTFAKGAASHAEGGVSSALGTASHAEGSYSIANGSQAHAEGYSSETGGNYTSNTKTAGTETDAGSYSHAEGNATIAQGIAAHSEGKSTFAKGNNSHAEGNGTKAQGAQSHAEGGLTNVTSSGANGHAEGRNTTVNGYASHAEGDTCETGGNYSSNTTNPKTPNSRTTTTGDYSHAEGNATIAYGVGSHAEGRTTFAKGTNSHAEGYDSVAMGGQSHAEGYKTVTNNSTEHAQGSMNVSHANSTFGSDSATQHTIGIGSNVLGRLNAVEVMQNGDYYIKGVGNYDGIHIKGETGAPTGLQTVQEVIGGKQDTLTAGTGISISGNTISISSNPLMPDSGFNYVTMYKDDDDGIVKSNTASGSYSNFAEGSKTTATSAYGGNHAEGYSTSATGAYGCHSEGGFTQATAEGAHAEGFNTIASGIGSHVEGFGEYGGNENVASGQGSHSEGSRNNASGYYTHAEGAFNVAQNFCEHTQGAANVSHSSANNAGSEWQGDASHTLHSIGYGRYINTRKNAVEVMQNADVYIKGIGGYDGVHIKNEVTGTTVYTLQDVITNILSYTEDLYWQLNKVKPLAPNQIRYTVNDGVEFYTNGSVTVASTEFNDSVGIITYDDVLYVTGDYDFSDFNSQDNITSVELPKTDTLYRLSDYCFRGQTNLKQFTIPISITEIGEYVFESCSSLEILKYEGTMDMWNNISFGTDWYVNTLLTQVICIDGVIQL